MAVAPAGRCVDHCKVETRLTCERASLRAHDGRHRTQSDGRAPSDDTGRCALGVVVQKIGKTPDGYHRGSHPRAPPENRTCRCESLRRQRYLVWTEIRGEKKLAL